jgi:TPR repeat protein
MSFVHGTDGLPHDVSQGLALMTKAGEQGHVRSLYGIGEYYRLGMFGVPKDASQSVAWHRKAADLGYDLSQDAVGIAYLSGLGVPKNINQAIFWFRKAADQGDDIAQFILGRTYEQGQHSQSPPTCLKRRQQRNIRSKAIHEASLNGSSHSRDAFDRRVTHESLG